MQSIYDSIQIIYNSLLVSIEEELCPICLSETYRAVHCIEHTDPNYFDSISCKNNCFHLSHGVISIRTKNLYDILIRSTNSRIEINQQQLRKITYQFPENPTIQHVYDFCKTMDDSLLFI